MSRKKMMIFGGLFLFAIVLIIIGSLLNKTNNQSKGKTNSQTTVNQNSNGGTTYQTKPPTSSEETNTIKKIYNVTKSQNPSGQEVQKLYDPTVKYEVDIPTADLNKMEVNQTTKDGITSTNYYYRTANDKVLVFSINNYPSYMWADYEGAVPDVVVGKTPIRVITFAYPEDNPFVDNSTNDAKIYNDLENKAKTTYFQSFKFNQK